MGLMTFNTDWKAVQHRYLPTKSMHHVNSCTTAVLIVFFIYASKDLEVGLSVALLASFICGLFLVSEYLLCHP